ncbi:fibronectin type III domain-containing protein [Paenibacillus sp. FSL H7-0714]|uniref:fibronectin type III domain-containing protein n=1 Tax=Paenibacillus sp. FSL H7-0714 TaxID=2954735 RepID=UPI0030F6F8C6
MKKIIMFAVSLFFVFSLSNVANAQPGGLLDGKPFKLINGTETYLFTDGDPNTMNFLEPSGPATYTSNVSMDISAIYYDWGPGNSYPANYRFYDSADKLLYTGTTSSRFQQKVFLPTVIKNVTKIIIGNSTYEYAREFDVWGTMNLERPLSVSALPGTKKINVSFTAPEGATGYYIYLNGTKSAHFTGTSYEVKNLLPDVSYTVQLSAEYNGNESPLTEAKTVIPYDNEVIPVLDTAADWGKITITWNKPETVKKYLLYVDDRAATEVEGMPFVLSGLSPETEYKLQVEYTDRYGRTFKSDVATVKTKVKPVDVDPPGKPTLLTAQMSSDFKYIIVTWKGNSETDLAGYNLFVTDNGGNKKKLNTSLLKSNSYAFPDFIADHEYVFSLEAVDESGNTSELADTSIKATTKPVTESEQENTAEYIIVTWKETPNAIEYLVFLNGRQVGTAGKDERSFKITRAMGYNPASMANVTLVKAKFADGSTGGGQNVGDPPIAGNPDGWGLTGSEIWKNVVLLVASLGIFMLLGICIRLAPKAFRILRQAINWRG